MSITVNTDAGLEAVSRALSGYGAVPPVEQERMIRRAAAVAKMQAFKTCVTAGLLLKLARKWRRDCGRPGGASVDSEARRSDADEARRQCARELEDIVNRFTEG